MNGLVKEIQQWISPNRSKVYIISSSTHSGFNAAQGKLFCMQISRADVADLIYFMAIARHRSFSRAAIELGVSASALSHALKGLETRLGVRLLNRTTKSVTPTAAGEELVQSVLQPFDTIEGALESLNRYRNTPTGRIRINAAVEEKVVLKTKHGQKAPENMSAFQIFCTYVLRNKNAWYVSFVDVFVYMVRFGMISWLPIYLLTVKHFSKEQMSVAFLFFEWAAIPSTLLAGWLSDKLFKGRRMPLAIICMTLIFICLIGYWKSESLLMVTVFAAIVGCLIYVPQFLASVQTMEIVPSFAVGSAVGLRGFMSYIFGASLGTSLFGVMVDKMGWHGGFYLLMGGIVCCILFCYLSHRGALELEQQRKNTEQEEARLALANAQ